MRLLLSIGGSSHGKKWAKKTKLNPKMIRELKDIDKFFYPDNHAIQDHFYDLVAAYIQESIRHGNMADAAEAVRRFHKKVFDETVTGNNEAVLTQWSTELQASGRVPLVWQEWDTDATPIRKEKLSFAKIPHRKEN